MVEPSGFCPSCSTAAVHRKRLHRCPGLWQLRESEVVGGQTQQHAYLGLRVDVARGADLPPRLLERRECACAAAQQHGGTVHRCRSERTGGRINRKGACLLSPPPGLAKGTPGCEHRIGE